MYPKTIKYVDYNGNEREEEFFFHMNQAELTEWIVQNGDYTLDQLLLRLGREAKGREVMAIFKDLILRSYGEKSLDGRRFIKSEEASKAFSETEAYAQLFLEIVGDAKKATEFLNGIMPKDLSEQVDKLLAENPEAIPTQVRDYLPEKPSNKFIPSDTNGGTK